MNYNHFNIEERYCIDNFLREGKSFREIAKIMRRAPSSISREVRRNAVKCAEYRARAAQRKYKVRKHYCHKGGSVDEEVKRYIEEKLLQMWSPEQIANSHCELKMPSAKTIYRWLSERILLSNGSFKVLRRKRQPYSYWTKTGKFQGGKSIRKRPKDVYKRKDFGHWEADTIQPGAGKGTACIGTLIERKSRYMIAFTLKTKQAEEMKTEMVKVLSQLPSNAVKTITFDRGSEFAEWRKIEQELNCQVYFTDPYRAWQKGSVENANGLLREFYPKGRTLSRVTANALNKKVKLINDRPRKVNNYLYAEYVFLYELKCCT